MPSHLPPVKRVVWISPKMEEIQKRRHVSESLGSEPRAQHAVCKTITSQFVRSLGLRPYEILFPTTIFFTCVIKSYLLYITNLILFSHQGYTNGDNSRTDRLVDNFFAEFIEAAECQTWLHMGQAE